MIASEQLSGLVLAGGQSSRLQELGPVDKGLLQLEGMALVERALSHLSPYVSQLFISANKNQERYATYANVLVDDPALGRWQGPLVGVLTTLEHISTPWLVCVPVDCPFLPVELVPRLMAASAQQPEQLAFYAQAARTHPLCLLLHQCLAASLRAYLARGGRRVHGWLAEVGAQTVPFGEQAEACFGNINTMLEWQAAQKERK